MFHIVIVWSTAANFGNEIVNDIKSNFDLIKIVKVSWDKSLFYNNLKIFYAHSLKDMTDSEMKRILKDKIKSVGYNPFQVIVFRDKAPQMQKRTTSSGDCLVNINVFDRKNKYRKMTGGSNIHSSNDEWETNKDLTLLFGKNCEDFVADRSINDEFEGNCLGVTGYESLEQLFYVLNNTLNYCVLRNFEGIPEQYTLKGHDDIDLLVDHRKYTIRLTNAKQVFPQSYRVYHNILIKGIETAFDFRFVCDDYYDEKWEKEILSKRILRKNMFYTPDTLNCFYSLLYHAYIQKPYVKEDYHPKLEKYASEIGAVYDKNTINAMGLLKMFLSQNCYRLKAAKDKSVYFNKHNILLIEGYTALESCGISELQSIHEDYWSMSGYVYFTGYYKGKKIFVKYGGFGNTCLNEYKMTSRAYSYAPQHFLQPLFFSEKGPYIIYEYVERIPLEAFLVDKNNKEEKSLIGNQIFEIYEALKKANIIHRDIRPDNIVVVHEKLILLDFQFALDAKEKKEIEGMYFDMACGLGKGFRYSAYAWNDGASFKQLVKKLDLNLAEDEIAVKRKLTAYMPMRYMLKLFRIKTNEKIRFCLISILKLWK